MFTTPGDLTPSQILTINAPQEIQDRAIYNFSLTHPDYNYVVDPGLEDIGKFIVSNAIFRGSADAVYRKPTLIERVESSWPLIANGLSLSVASVIVGGGENRHTIRGREAHRNYRNALDVTYEFEQNISRSSRVDAIDRTNRIVRELKPDNPRAIARGLKQLQRYVHELQQQTGQIWQGFLDTYRK